MNLYKGLKQTLHRSQMNVTRYLLPEILSSGQCFLTYRDLGWGWGVAATHLFKFRSLSGQGNKSQQLTAGFTRTMPILKYTDIFFVLKHACILIFGKSKNAERGILQG